MRSFSKYLSKTEKDTVKIANTFSQSIKTNSIIYLVGNVGSGKTYFAKSLAENFGIKNMCSSTYSYVTSYFGTLNLVHCDLYRCHNTPQVIYDEIIEHLKNPWLLIIEWPLYQISIPSNSYYVVEITRTLKNDRIYKIKSFVD